MKKDKKVIEAKSVAAKDAPKEGVDISPDKLAKKRNKAEIEALLKAYKEKNPVKYALKEKNGEFDRLLAK